MKKTSTLSFLKQLLFFLTILFCNYNLIGQEYIPFQKIYPDLTKGDEEIIKGNMIVIGNSILGIKETIKDTTYTAFSGYTNINDYQDYTDITTHTKDYNNNDDYYGRDSNTGHIRAYHDIDSDPTGSTKYLDSNGDYIFQALLSSESEYGGMPTSAGVATVNNSVSPPLLTNNYPLVDDFGAPNYGEMRDDVSNSISGTFTPGTEIGTFSSSTAQLKINSDGTICSTVKRAYLYWGGIYAGESHDLTIQATDSSTNREHWNYPVRKRPECEGGDCELYTDIKILPPGGSEYIDIKFNPDTSDGYGLKTEIVYDDCGTTKFNSSNDYKTRTNYIWSNYNKQSTLYNSTVNPAYSSFSFNGLAQGGGWVAHPTYACRADVTSLLKDIETSEGTVDGFWTVANIRVTTGNKAYGTGGGWTLVVVYEDPNEIQKYISLFDGYTKVSSGITPYTVDGFTTPPNGDVNVEYAGAFIEGDGGGGDNVTIEDPSGVNQTIVATEPVGVPNSTGYNAYDFFDGSILTIDREDLTAEGLLRYPYMRNTLGYDSDHFVLNNLGNRLIENNQSSANFEMTAKGPGGTFNDQTATFFTGFSIDVIAPDVQIFKEALDENGNTITSSTVRDLGDEIRYRITLTNIGSGEAVNTIFRDRIPINTVFDPLTSDFNITPLLPDGYNFNYTSVDSGEVDSDGNPIFTTEISIELPDSLDGVNGGVGFLEPLQDGGSSVEITFSVNIIADCRLLRNACAGVIENQADAEYSTVFDTGDIIPVKSAFEKNACNVLVEGPTITLADQAACTATTLTETQCIDAPLDITAGSGFDVYTWYTDAPGGTEGSFDDGIDTLFPTDAEENPTANQQIISVYESGYYHVVQETTGVDCQKIALTYKLEGLDFFNSGIDPFANVNKQNELLCSDSGQYEVTELLLCSGSAVLGSTEYPAGTTVAWQKLDDSADCTQSNYCAYPNTNLDTGAACFAPAFSTAHTYEFTEAGVFKLTVTLTGGCPFEYYFNTITYDFNPVLTLSGSSCAGGDAIITLNGVDLDGSGNLDGYTVAFVPSSVDITDADFDTQVLNTDRTQPTYTRTEAQGNLSIKAYVIPNSGGNLACEYPTNDLDVKFIDLAIDGPLEITQPTCFEDRIDTSDDDSKGKVRINVTGDDNLFYYYYLNNTTDNTKNQVSGQKGVRSHLFENVDPGTYTIDVYSSSKTESSPDPIDNCKVTSIPFTINEIPGYRATISTTPLSCNPAQIIVTVESLDATNPVNFNDINVIFTDANNAASNKTYSYSSDGNTPITFLVDDSSVVVTTYDPDSGVFTTTDSDSDMYIDDLYTDESGSNTLDNNIIVQVFSSSCPLDIPNVVINPFDLLELSVTSPREPSCKNDANGQVKIRADGSNTSSVTGYEITAADDTSQIGKTTNIGGVFRDLTAGEYTFTAYQNINGISCTAEVTYTLGEPDPITTPIIIASQDYTCTTNEGHIDLQTGFTVSGGNTPYTYRLFQYAEATLTTLEDTREVNNANRLPFEGLTDGFYVLEIEDRNSCTSELSNIIEFLELQQPELEYTATTVTCSTTNSTVQVDLVTALTNGDTIEGYSISNVTDTASPTTPTAYNLNTTGEFTLAPGDYEITARTTSTQCVSDVLAFTIDNVVNIDAFNTSGGNDTLSCINADDGSVDYDLSGISTGGYSYAITQNTIAYTPEASNPQPGVNLTSTDFELTNLEQGAYEITFTDADTNCTDVVAFSISNPQAIVLSEAVAPQYSCNSTGLGTYTFQVSAIGGTGAISFSDGSTTNATGQFTVNATTGAQSITITATDANTCTETIDVNIPATTDLVITTPAAQCIDNGNNDEVTITFTGATGNILYKEDGDAIFTTATITGNTFIIDTNKTIGDTYTYLITDDNNNESCARRVEITFNDDISVKNITTTTVSCNAVSGAQATSGASISFEVEGGTGNYTYTTSEPITVNTSNVANPTFSASSLFDDQTITITINDASGCGVPFTLDYTPDYPEEPTIDTINVPTFVCDGDTIDVTITPDFESGEDLTSFIYIFDGVEQNSNIKPYTEDGTTAFTYSIKRRSTGCAILPPLDGTLNSVAPITVTNIVTTNEICNSPAPPAPPLPPTKGTATITINNGTSDYSVTVTNLDDSSILPITQTTSSNTIVFDPLEIGSYSVEIIDDNGCRLQDYTEFRIIPEPNVQFKNETIISNCIDKVIYFFEIEDGVGPFDIGLSLATVIDPTILGDNIFKYGDSDFPQTTFDNEQTAAQIGSYTDFSRVYAIIGLEFDQAYSVFVQDVATNCYSSADVAPQPSEDLTITVGNTVETSACGLNSGEVEFSFNIIDPSQIGEDYYAEIIEVDGTVDPSVTPLLIENVAASNTIDPNTGEPFTLTGISGGSHTLRIRPATTANECSGTIDFNIDTADPLGALEIAFSKGTSCINPASLELRVAGGGGVTPYEYLLQPSGDPAPISGDSTIFPETAVISNTTIQSFTDINDNLVADAYVRDASGCVVGPLAINIAALVEPTLSLGTSPQDCDPAGAYTTTYTIGNYDGTFTYSFEVNGDTPGNAQVTISAPDGSGEGTVSAQNRDAYVIEVTASNNPDCPASDTFNLAEDVINIQATLSDVDDCNGNLENISIEVVKGGYVGVATRQLVYEVYQASTVAGTPIATLTPSPLETSVTFNAGTDYGSGALVLSADTDYSVLVTDYYDQINFPTRFCTDIQEGLRRTDIVLPTLTVDPDPVSCSTTDDGQITLTSSITSGVTYALYEFADGTAAQTAIDNDLVEVDGATIASNPTFTQGNIFSNLKGTSSAAYVGVVYATSLSCPVYSVVTSLSEPTSTSASSFVIDGVDGNCDSTDLVTDALPRVTIQINGALASAIADYEITITPTVAGVANPFTFSDLSLVGGTTDTYYIDGNSVPSQTYTINISDTNTSCPPLIYTQTINCDTELDELGVTIPNYAIDCFDPTATINATFEVTAANGNPLLYDYQIYPKGDSGNVLASGDDIATSPISPAANLPEGTYILYVKDENETRIPPITREFVVSMPDDLPNFTLSQERTDCDAILITATPINGTGTPNTGNPAYTFEISDAGGTAMASQVNGTAIYTVTAPTTGTDTYTVTITDANSCPNTNTIDIVPQEQLAATVIADEVCLNEGDANAVITITSGTPPFTFVRTNTTNSSVTNGTLTQTSLPFSVDNTIAESGSFDYVITDSFGCEVTVTGVVINNPLTLSIDLNPASTACDASNNPETSSYDLTVSGGNSSYTYEVAIGETAINTNNFVTYTGPNYTVNASQEGERFAFRVTDGLTCSIIVEPALITFPTFPEVTFSNLQAIECPGENGSAELTVDPTKGKAPYQIFVTETGTAFPASALAGDPIAGITFATTTVGIYDYKVIDANGCESAVGNFAINNSVIETLDFDIQDIICSAASVVTSSGSIFLEVTNAELPITFELFEEGVGSIATHTEPITGDYGHTFTMLEAGNYTIEVTDANNCQPFEFDATINNNSPIVIANFEEVNTDCAPAGTGVTMIFSVDGEDPFTIEHPLGGGLVDPLTTGDLIFKKDDLTDPFSGQGTVVASDNDKYYAVSGLAAGTEYTILVQDNDGCQQRVTFRTPDSDDIANITTTVVPESICNSIENTDGTIAVNFELGTSVAGSFDVYLYNEDETALAAPTQTGVAINPAADEAVFTGLNGSETYIIRITENGLSPQCGNPIEVDIDKATELELNVPAAQSPVNCNGYVIDISASAQLGVPPYEFQVVPSGNPVTFTGTSNLTIDTNLGADLIWDVYVRDSSIAGCTAPPQQITITNEPSPTFVIDPEFSVDQCADNLATYTVTAEITNYNINLSPYTFTVNGTNYTGVTAAAGALNFEVNDRDTYIIEVSDKNGCTADDTITIYNKLEVTASLGNPDCDGNVDNVTASITGGYNEIGRVLTYEIFAINDMSTAISTSSDGATFAPVFTLQPNIDYVVTVTDNFTSVSSNIAPSCLATSEVLNFEAIEKSSIKTTKLDASCNGLSDGSILIEALSTGETPIVYELYSYPNIGAANTDITTVNSGSSPSGTNVTATYVNGTNELLFENLPIGAYATFVTNGNSPLCFTTGSTIEIIEPDAFDDSQITINPIAASCAPIQQSPGIEITIGAAAAGELPYFYKINGLVNTFTEFETSAANSSFVIPNIIAIPGQTYTVEFIDSSCGTGSEMVTIPEFNPNPNLALQSTTSDYSCNSSEQLVLEITNALVTYTFTNTLALDLSGNTITTLTPLATTSATANFEIITPGRYLFEAQSSLGCVSNELEYIVREVEQLRVEASGNTVTCFSDTTSIEFEVLDYEGDYTYTYSYLDATNSTVTSAPITENTIATPIVTIGGLNVNTYTINVVAGPDPANSICSNTAIAQITGPNGDISFLVTDELSLTPIPVPTCNNYTATIVTPEVTGGVLPYTFTLLATDGSTASTPSNETGVFDITTVTITDYTVEITDANNCSIITSAVKTVAPLVPPTIDPIAAVQIECFGGSETFNVVVNNTSLLSTEGELTYALYNRTGIGAKGDLITPANTIDEFTVNYAEFGYVVEVSDGVACPVNIDVMVNQPNQLELIATETEAMSCDNAFPLLINNSRTQALYQITATGGTPGPAGAEYTYELLKAEGFNAAASAALVGTTNNDGVFVLNENTSYTFSVTDSVNCQPVTTVVNVGDGIKDIFYEITYETSPICNGADTGFVYINANPPVGGGEGNFEYRVYEVVGVTETEIRPGNVLDQAFTGLYAGNYIYEVISAGTSCSTRIPFEIIELPAFDWEVGFPRAIGVSCNNENDGSIQLKVMEGIFDSFTDITSLTYEIINSNTSFSVRETIQINKFGEDDIAEFTGLAPDTYTYKVSINGSALCFIEDTIEVEDKAILFVDFVSIDPVICRNETDGSYEFLVSGGTSPYYYTVVTGENPTEPNAEDISGNTTYLLDDALNGRLVIDNLAGDTQYTLYVYDSGNGETGDDFRVCSPWIESLDPFLTEDLDNFIVNPKPNCTNLGYTIEVNNNSPVEFPEQLRIYVYNTNDGTLVATGGPGLEEVDVPAGNYSVEIGNETTMCRSITRTNLDELEPYDPIQFVKLNENGEAIQPFAATNQINVYQLQVTGGIDPSAYRYEGTYTSTNDSFNTLTINDDGTFEITKSGAYTFTVYDDASEDGVGCFDTTGTIGLNYIAIDIPNVFNPTSNDPLTYTWYPDNLTADFQKPGVTNPLSDNDPNTPPIPTIYQTTGGVVIGGTTTGGTTTDGYTVGGNITSNTNTIPINSISPGTASVTYTATGGTTTNGVTTGGLIIETITETNGTVTIRVIKGGTIIGGSPTSGGVIVGGTLDETGASVMETFTDSTSGGSTSFTITTEGTTTDGTTTGGTTTDGATIGNTTTGGTTYGATTEGGVTTGGTTTIITIDPTGTTIEALTNTTITNGTTKDGVTTGGTTTGGTLSGGTELPVAVEYLDYKNMEVLIFDRYGRLLAKFEGIEEKRTGGEGWDGTYQGKEMPSGDYWYIIKLNDSQGREFTGHFTLYRR